MTMRLTDTDKPFPDATLDDADTLARTTYGEARGEIPLGQIAVAWVPRHRAAFARDFIARLRRPHPLFGDGTIKSACLRPKQFTCWNADDKNRAKLLAVTAAKPAFRACLEAARLVIAGQAPDPVSGARHYHTIAAPPGVAVWPPSWTNGHEPIATIGGHVFYNTVT